MDKDECCQNHFNALIELNYYDRACDMTKTINDWTMLTNSKLFDLKTK